MKKLLLSLALLFSVTANAVPPGDPLTWDQECLGQAHFVWRQSEYVKSNDLTKKKVFDEMEKEIKADSELHKRIKKNPELLTPAIQVVEHIFKYKTETSEQIADRWYAKCVAKKIST